MFKNLNANIHTFTSVEHPMVHEGFPIGSLWQIKWTKDVLPTPKTDIILSDKKKRRKLHNRKMNTMFGFFPLYWCQVALGFPSQLAIH